MVKHNYLWEQTHIELQDITFELIKSIPESKITVTKLCKLANINRSTFYNHYLDVPDLIEAAKHSKSIQLVNLFRKLYSSQNFTFLSTYSLKIYLKFLKDNGDYYKIILAEPKVFPLKSDDYLYNTERLTEIMKKHLKRTDPMMSNAEFSYYLIIFESTIFNITRNWALNNYDMTIDKITKIIINSLPKILYNSINK